ncbi:gpmB [Symbiodinium sp. CCMP2592]|nr:gpmB [Symbiodinium sp. CCMP2592]
MAQKVMKKEASPHGLLKRPLRHRFFALRHGESKANVAKIIISDPKVGTKKYGLTKAGSRFIKSASSRVVIVSSDFSRARETAQVFAKTLRKAGLTCPVRLSTALRERRFGSLEGGSDSRYNEVWSKDRRNAAARPFGAESAKAVQMRTAKLVSSLDRDLPDGADVVLVSHGDALQILQTAFQGISAASHRSLSHLDRAELRALNP